MTIAKGDEIMSQQKASVQSLIDHIKTAVDVDPWAKEMAEELLKRQQPEPVRIGRFPVENKLFSHCPRCGLTLDEFIHQPSELRPLYCPICGQKVKWK